MSDLDFLNCLAARAASLCRQGEKLPTSKEVFVPSRFALLHPVAHSSLILLEQCCALSVVLLTIQRSSPPVIPLTMKFSQHYPFIGAMFLGLATSSPAPHYGSEAGAVVTRNVPATWDLKRSWEDQILFSGVAAPETAGGHSAVQLGIRLPKAAVAGSVAVSVTDSFLVEPTLRVGLSGVQAYFELDLSTSAGVYESIELFASEESNIAVSPRRSFPLVVHD